MRLNVLYAAILHFVNRKYLLSSWPHCQMTQYYKTYAIIHTHIHTDLDMYR